MNHPTPGKVYVMTSKASKAKRKVLILDNYQDEHGQPIVRWKSASGSHVSTVKLALATFEEVK